MSPENHPRSPCPVGDVQDAERRQLARDLAELVVRQLRRHARNVVEEESSPNASVRSGQRSREPDSPP